MKSNLPMAVVVGANHFVAKKLIRKLLEKDLVVMGVDDGWWEGGSGGNFEFVTEVGEIEGRAEYVFDFRNNEKGWLMAKEMGAKLEVILIDCDLEEMEKTRQELTRLGSDWRLVVGKNVYGPGMGEENNYWSELLMGAAGNRQLILPMTETVRPLSSDDLVEAELRAMFLSGIGGEVLTVWGEEIAVENVGRILVNEARMTKTKPERRVGVTVENGEKSEIAAVWQKLRWQPEIQFGEGIKESLQYFLTKKDEENRKRKNSKQPAFAKASAGRQEPNEKRYEVMVEEVINNDELIINNSENQKTEEAVNSKEEEQIIKVEEKQEENREAIKKKEIELDEFDDDEEEEEAVGKEINEDEIDWLTPIIKNRVLKEEKERDSGTEEVVERIENRVEDIKIAPRVQIKKGSWLKGKRWMIGGGILAVVVVIMMVLPISLGWQVMAVVKSVGEVRKLVTERKWNEAIVKIDAGEKTLAGVETKIEEWDLKRWEWVRRVDSGIKVMEGVLEMERLVVPIAESSQKINESIFGDKEIDWASELKIVQSNLDDLENEAGVVSARLKGDWSWLPVSLKKDYEQAVVQLAEGRKMAGEMRQVIGVLPEILGTDGKRRDYLIIFQNEMELRPTGGFIGSYGVLSFEGGRLLNFEVKDVYGIDGQLAGHVEPPAEIKKYLGEANWYLRDSNWNADFMTTSRDILWFFEKETGRRMDGVIGVDLAVARRILGVVGEVYVPDFKEKVNKDNLYEQAEFYAESKFFPGSVQKQSFLSGLGKQLFEQIKTQKPDTQVELLKAIMGLLDEKEILVAMNNAKVAKTMADSGWDGSMYIGKCSKADCYADYLFPVEANLGVNKANYFLYRNIEETVDISNNAISRIVRINYENTAKNTNWPGGDYKNYMRVYLPDDVNLAEVSVYDTDNRSVKTIYGQTDLKIGTVKGRKEIGFLVTVPVLKKRTIELRYSTSIDLQKVKGNLSYLSYIQKQPGMGSTGLVTLVSYPPEWQPVEVEPLGSLVKGKILFNLKMDTDIKMGVSIGR